METNSVHDYSQYQSAGDMQSPAAFQQPESSNVDKSPGGVILGLLSAVLSGAVGYYNNERQREEQRYLMERSAELNRLQWERENEYNTPAAQMQRFREAGLNPNMVLGKDSESGHTSVSNGASAPVLPNWFHEGVQSFRDSQMLQAQIDNINADTDVKKVEAGANAQRVEFERQLKDNAIKRTDAEIDSWKSQSNLQDAEAEYYKSLLSKISQDIDESIAREGFLTEQIKQLQFINSHAQEKFDKDMQEQLSRINVNNATASKISRELWEMIDTYKVRFEQLTANVDLTKASTIEKQQLALKIQGELISMSSNIVRNLANYRFAKPFIEDPSRVNWDDTIGPNKATDYGSVILSAVSTAFSYIGLGSFLK